MEEGHVLHLAAGPGRLDAHSAHALPGDGPVGNRNGCVQPHAAEVGSCETGAAAAGKGGDMTERGWSAVRAPQRPRRAERRRLRQRVVQPRQPVLGRARPRHQAAPGSAMHGSRCWPVPRRAAVPMRPVPVRIPVPTARKKAARTTKICSERRGMSCARAGGSAGRCSKRDPPGKAEGGGRRRQRAGRERDANPPRAPTGAAATHASGPFQGAFRLRNGAEATRRSRANRAVESRAASAASVARWRRVRAACARARSTSAQSAVAPGPGGGRSP